MMERLDDREGSFVAVRRISQGSRTRNRLHLIFSLSTEECLQNRIDVAYDSTIPLHQLISEQWKEMGWQGKDPSTDFRGGGFISLENLLYFARNFQKSFQDLLRKQAGERSVWEYPFAVAGINLTFMLIQMLDLEAVKPRTITFLKFLSENESAFDILYCIAFKLMDQQWLSMHIHGIQHGDEINKETAGERADAGRYNAS
uniref:ELMO domain-containing protein n=1 Tax=Brassica oleracea var. oleracea TaxID=109376 RepID=A0A0D3B6R6_BRAOL